jgi:predicted branched-subunit amino acid permease
LLASAVPDNWGLDLAGTLALVPLIVSAVISRSMLAAVAVAGIVAIIAIDLPYRLALPLAVFAAIAAGSIADVVAERADFRRQRAARSAVHAADLGKEP